MKIAYSHLLRYISENPSIDDLSEKLFQLGHEHEILDDIFDMEFTPNRGDCLSLKGLLRDLSLFYTIENKDKIYEKLIDSFDFEFINNAKNDCPKITFLKVDIDKQPSSYKDYFNNYFVDLNLNKNNFFADISNFLSYETGQPTHCYDFSRIHSPIRLDFINDEIKFNTLLDTDINIYGKNLVFIDNKKRVINLAGIIGSNDTACTQTTKSVLIECAYFNPEKIIGKQVKFGVKSDAAHKFERDTDPCSHEYVLRRFLKIIEDHANIINTEIYSEDFLDIPNKKLPLNIKKLNQILGTDIDNDLCKEMLTKLGFIIQGNEITVPSYRRDVESLNDISEELARAIGYNSIKNKSINIPKKDNQKHNFKEDRIKSLLLDNGFYEVINNPFVEEKSRNSIMLDNPLDSNRKFLRTSLETSLTFNMLYNERRQHDSIKLFEISNIYLNEQKENKKVIGIIGTGRVGRNYKDFTKKIDKKYFFSILGKYLPEFETKFLNISRTSINSKSKTPISYIEVPIDSFCNLDYPSNIDTELKTDYIKYNPISNFPSSSRDLSLSIKNKDKVKEIESLILNEEDDLLKEVYVFDFYDNPKSEEIKIGFRLIFQSSIKNITDKEVDSVMKKIIDKCLDIDSVSIPGLNNA